MIPASDHLGSWHQLKVFAHLNCNRLGFGLMDDFLLHPEHVVFSVRTVWTLVQPLFHQPVTLGFARAFLACHRGLWTQWPLSF